MKLEGANVSLARKLAPQLKPKAGYFFRPKTAMISRIQTEPLHHSEFFLRQKNLVEGMSANEIAAQIFSARSTVINALRAFNIPIRSCDEQRRLTPTQLRYGERLIKGQVISHKGEMQVIERMREMRRKGLSLRDIATTLEADRLPTKNGKRWHATTVMKILNAHAQTQGEAQ